MTVRVNSQIAEKLTRTVFWPTGCFRNESRIVGFYFPDSWNAYLKYCEDDIFIIKRSAITNFCDSADSIKRQENLVGGLFVKCELMT